jgi:acyl carrier protein
MNREEILQRVQAVFTELFEIEPERVQPAARLVEDLDLDSIDAIDMVVKLQELIGKRVEETELRRVRTVEDIIELVFTHTR